MNKDTFLNELEKRLRVIDWQERKEILNYYEELILDRMENTNKTEEDIISELGSIDDIANKIINKNDKIKVEDSNSDSNNNIIGIVIAVVLIPVWITLFSLIFGLIAGIIGTGIGIIGGGIVVIIGGFSMLSTNFSLAVFYFGIGLLLIGIGLILAPLIFKLLVWVSNQIIKLIKYITSNFKRRLNLWKLKVL